ncbi:hypothetical protein B4Q13_22830 [Lacticaseibacillus rhamnosus]
MSAAACSACICVWQITTHLPAASPSAFTTPGTYKYCCTHHESDGMVATVIVGGMRKHRSHPAL